MGARLRWASLTIETICASSVSLPTRVASITKLPDPLSVPPVTGLPAFFSAGMGSPVSIDSSMALVPSVTRPSTGTFSEGRTRSLSPTRMLSSETSSSLPSASIRLAVFGASPRSARMAPEVAWRARSSSTWPSSTG